MRSLLLAATAAALGLAAAASAQDTGADPYYGSVALDAGFLDDPYSVSITAGGSVDASSLGAGCVGSIGDPPDFELTFNAGSSPLYLSATSDSDVSLVVNGPNGDWICDDDSAGNLNPGLTLNPAQSGVYDIWVGDLTGSGPATTLFISEIGYQTDAGGADGAGSGIDFSGTPYFGEVTLASGFSEDPYSVYISAGGANDASTLGGSCAGTIGGPPDFNLHYTAGSLPLYISASSDDDLTLVVNTPDGSWACDDDSGEGPLDPGLTWSKPASGTYNIWVGHYSGGGNPDATLHISEVGYHATRVDGGSAGGIDASAEPVYGSVELTAGFTPDPYTLALTPGGDNDARTVSESCIGNVGGAPDFDLYYTSGSYPLHIYVESDSDTTLVINTPDGEWICDDDSSVGLNPGVSFKSPADGLYDIWVGTFGGAEGEATLNISENAMPTD